MKDIAIYGAGGLGREIACLLLRINQITPRWNLIGFFDDGKEVNSENEYGRILGGINELNTWDTSLAVVFGIGNPRIVYSIVNNVSSPMVYFPNIIAPGTIFLDQERVQLGQGNVFCYNCIVSCNVKIGDFNVFNGMISVGHDVIIGSFNAFMPAVRVSGEVKIGDVNFFGVSSVILQQVNIGDKVILGAASVMIRNPKNDMTYIGNPAVRIKY
ncbi:PglD-related sugar-binding protein [Butyricimonas paravirosa]|uniref:PglD-related sugar-binding protein n=1 Tax=Butyricimonas paravirosa TaxID=1472417 RepID=UPI0022DEBD0D|nr:serine acetyltransferase [Butyricimonas paravirosa]